MNNPWEIWFPPFLRQTFCLPERYISQRFKVILWQTLSSLRLWLVQVLPLVPQKLLFPGQSDRDCRPPLVLTDHIPQKNPSHLGILLIKQYCLACDKLHCTVLHLRKCIIYRVLRLSSVLPCCLCSVAFCTCTRRQSGSFLSCSYLFFE